MTDKVETPPVEEEQSLRDMVAEAMNAPVEEEKPTASLPVEEKPESPPPEKPEPAPQADKKEETPPAEAAKEPETPQGQWTQDKPPSSWTPGAQARWAEIPEDLRKEIVRREEASVRGLQQMRESYAPMDKMANDLYPFIKEAIDSRVEPSGYISSVLTTERNLRMGDKRQKFDILLQIGDQYGIPLREIINKSVGEEILKAPEAAPVAQLPPELMQELQESRKFREEYSQTNALAEVERFGKDKPYFEAVRGRMADLIDKGAATSLEDAYDQATWGDATIRGKLIAAEKGQKINENQQRAAKVAVKDSDVVDTVTIDENDDSIIAEVRRAYLASSSGRL